MQRNPVRSSTRLLTCAVAAGAVLTLAACGSEPQDSPDETFSESELPLNAWLEGVMGDGMNEEALAAEQTAIEERVAACMADQGFEYIPSSTNGISFTIEDDGPEWGTAQWAEKNGYGVFAMPEAPQNGDETEGTDPNAALVEAMSPTEQEAYYEALYGGVSVDEDQEEEAEPLELDLDDMGCYGKAQSASQTLTMFQDEEFKALEEDIGTLSEAWKDDSAVTAASRVWAECMAKAGFGDQEWSSPADPEQWFRDKQEAFWETTSEQGSQDTEESDPMQSPEWKKLAEQEIDTAVADHTCQKSSTWAKAKYTAQAKAEKEFLDSHKATFDSLAARYGQDSK